MTGKTAKKTSSGSAVAKPYQPTEQERAAATAHLARRKSTPDLPRMKITEDKRRAVLVMEPDHANTDLANVLLMEALKTVSPEFSNGIVNGVVNATTKGATPTAEAVNFAISAIRGIGPRDETETLLAAQMTVVHMALMTNARSLINAGTLQHLEAHERTVNKLARTFASQLEALKRYRSGGEQTVRVEHVTVTEGGQAIIGNVSHGGGGTKKKAGPTS